MPRIQINDLPLTDRELEQQQAAGLFGGCCTGKHMPTRTFSSTAFPGETFNTTLYSGETLEAGSDLHMVSSY